MSSQAGVTVRRRLLGVGFIVLIAALIALSISMYNKAFTPFVTVTLQTDKVGNQLNVLGDVKVRGLIVGEIRKITPKADGAELELALDPEKVDLIPRNVTAQFIPKTLFGDRYVALQIPDNPAPVPLRGGDVIQQDKSKKAVELEAALEHLLPVLQAVQPEKLSSTLTAIATALDGRGKPLGETMAELGRLVGELNPHLPQLQHDVAALAELSDTYTEALPDIITALNDLTVTSRTVVEQRANLDELYASLTTSTQNLDAFLRANKDNLIQLADRSRPTLELLAKYAPEVPCFMEQMAGLVDPANELLGRGAGPPGLSATIEIVVNRGPYEPGEDTPRFDEHRGPRCYDPADYCVPFPEQPPEGPLRDGTSPTPPPRQSCDKTPPPATIPSAATGAGLGLPNSPQERELLANLLAPELGTDPGGVPGWSSLLIGPLFRGAEVSFR
ncbi:MAG TPA: MCE family protein [Actinophytocola sp.]|uniref:MCE family protein n=1 Tax=Actinophytocola sp. TaxID=1872138 RepID=UPI002DDDB8C0|nr:MCE family protein [Actinophytocola sp.]HEV2778026.1 MCE family protein [Actinophytocola sp.]